MLTFSYKEIKFNLYKIGFSRVICYNKKIICGNLFMAYALSKQALNDVIDPYKINLLNTEPIITREDIENKLNKQDVYEKQGNDARENLIRKIAYMVLNPQFQLVRLNDDFSSGHIEDKAEFMAMLFDPNGEAIVDYMSPQIIDKFKASEVSVNFERYKTEFFSWDNLSYYLEDTWKNVEYVLQRIESVRYDEWKEIFKNFREEMMDDLKFQQGFEKLVQQKPNAWHFITSDSTPTKILLHPKCLDWMEQEKDVFMKLSKEVYVSILMTVRSEQDDKKCDSYYINHRLRDNYNENKNAFIEQITMLDKQYRARFFEGENKQQYIDIILGSKDLRRMFYIFPKELLENPVLIKNFLEYESRENYFSFNEGFPYHIMTKDIALMDIFLNRILPSYNSVKHNDKIWQSWIEHKPTLLTYGKLCQPIMPRHRHDEPPVNHFIKFFEVLPTSFRKDIDVMKMFIGMRARIYNNLGQNMRDNPDLLEAYVNGFTDEPDDFKANKVSMKAFINSTREIQIKVIEKMPDFIAIDGFPQELLDEPDFVIARSRKNGDVVVTTELMNKIMTSPELLHDFILAHKKNFFLLPEHFKRNVNLAKVWSQHMSKMYHTEISKYKQGTELPQMLWASQDFCLHLLQVAKGNISYSDAIRPEFWQDRFFVVKLLKMIDEDLINESVMECAPEKMKAIKEFYKVKKGGYESAFAPCLSKAQLQQDLQVSATPIKRKKI